MKGNWSGMSRVVYEECITQHKLLICVLDLKEKLVRSKVKFMKRCKVWKLTEAGTGKYLQTESAGKSCNVSR